MFLKNSHSGNVVCDWMHMCYIPLAYMVARILVLICSQDWECRDEDDMIIIERILLLIRNILHIPTEASEEQVCVSLRSVCMYVCVCVFMCA